ncbi:nodulation protein NfeD [candidate division TA06 bacterium]|uniref:Nodulation protein NfeD n=1 Tax=candidate division TA06 bacterium TaxID=2250710 RepID=A0A523XU36_UNCT6|nr:MAG: nodulation protein NfeD [candidate division TA06 bacterium]
MIVKSVLISLVLLMVLAGSARAEGEVYVIRIDGLIGPVTSRYFVKTLERATSEGAHCLVVELDTPGGLDLSMRDMIKATLNSEIPVIVYVYPSGARDASAGVFITLAAHVAAMAPGTNIGAAHPVEIGKESSEEMKEKLTNDAAAYIKSIAETRGRNSEWAEKAVRESVSETEEDALKKNIIDFIAKDLDELLEKIDGKKVSVRDAEVILKTKDAVRKRIPMTPRENILSRLANPNIAFILLMLGFYGLFFELSHPGAIFPGVVGGICIILAFFSFQTLPINYAGVLLIILGMGLFIMEALTPTYGPLAIGGVVALVLGATMLVNTDLPFLRVSWSVIIPVVLITAAFFLFGMGMVVRAHRRKPTTGRRGMIGLKGDARATIDSRQGQVLVHGELWSAISEKRIKKGERIKVVDVDGLVLKVETLES